MKFIIAIALSLMTFPALAAAKVNCSDPGQEYFIGCGAQSDKEGTAAKSADKGEPSEPSCEGKDKGGKK